jgi:hypothetical protein
MCQRGRACSHRVRLGWWWWSLDWVGGQSRAFVAGRDAQPVREVERVEPARRLGLRQKPKRDRVRQPKPEGPQAGQGGEVGPALFMGKDGEGRPL